MKGDSIYRSGRTNRDDIAIRAMTGVMMTQLGEAGAKTLAELCYLIADSMIKESNRVPEG